MTLWQLSADEGVDVCERGARDGAHRFVGEEALVRGDEHVGEGEQPGKHIVIEDLVGEISEEEIASAVMSR